MCSKRPVAASPRTKCQPYWPIPDRSGGNGVTMPSLKTRLRKVLPKVGQQRTEFSAACLSSDLHSALFGLFDPWAGPGAATEIAAYPAEDFHPVLLPHMNQGGK